MYSRYFLVVLLVLALQDGFAQKESTSKAIDSLLSEWNHPNLPALSIAVVKDGETVYERHLGMRNIKAGLFNDASSEFWIASVSKQFTAAAIYLLASEKRLSLAQSIVHYFPELPAIYKPVTINHLLHHTSGVRDGFVLTALSKKPEALYTNENVMAYIKRQTKLNFSPGTQYEYNNSGYVLLALVIEKVSGQPFPAFLKQAVFLPLAMNKTYVAGKVPTRPEMAVGYHSSAGSPSGFEEGQFQGNTYGSTGIITTLADLVVWSRVVQQPAQFPSFKPVIRQLLLEGALKGGKKIAYAGGLEKFVRKGSIVYEHFGMDEGYKANIVYFPAAQLSIIGLTNNSSDYRFWQLLYSVADLVHEEKGGRFQLQPSDEQPHLTRYFYSHDALPMLRLVSKYANCATLSTTPGGFAAPYKIKGHVLQSLDPMPTTYQLTGNTLAFIDPYYHGDRKLKHITPEARTGDLLSFAGEYHSAEVEATYTISKSGNQLFFQFAPGIEFSLFRLTTTDFVFDYNGANYIRFSKEGFLFSRDGCRQLEFKRQ